MKKIIFIVSGCLLLSGSISAKALQDESVKSPKLVAKILPAKVTKRAIRVTIPIVTTTTTTTVPKKEAPIDSNCPEYFHTALESGWTEEQWENLDYIMWRESRCQPEVHNKQDPAGGSRGLIQINGFWCRPSRYYPEGYLQSQDALNQCSDLFDPQTNLEAGLVIYNYGVENHGCGWGPWSTKNTDWC